MRFNLVAVAAAIAVVLIVIFVIVRAKESFEDEGTLCGNCQRIEGTNKYSCGACMTPLVEQAQCQYCQHDLGMLNNRGIPGCESCDGVVDGGSGTYCVSCDASGKCSNCFSTYAKRPVTCDSCIDSGNFTLPGPDGSPGNLLRCSNCDV